MKKTIFLFLCLIMIWQSAFSLTVNCTPGGLSAAVGSALNTTINLTITGSIDARDFKTMRDNMNAISDIDLSSAIIVEYSGTLGTSTNTTVYPANEIPTESFYMGKSQKLSLTNVILPNALNSIGSGAFYNCYNLKNMIIPETVTNIKDRAFQSCNSFTDIVIPNGVTVINMILYDCTGLLSLTIGNAVTSIKTWAFGCSNLKTFNCLSTTPPTVESNWFYGSNVTDVFVPTDDAVTAFRANNEWVKMFPGTIIKKVGTTAGPFLSVSANSLSVSSAANSSTTFTITSNTSWTISSDQSVCVVNPTSGSNNATITVTATTANTASTSRTANLTISGVGVTNNVIPATQAAGGEVSLTVISTAGGLSTAITAAGGNFNSITNLTITGVIDARDFKLLRSYMASLSVLDLSSVNIAAYTGIDGTVGSNTVFPINAIPQNGLIPIAPYTVNVLTRITLPTTITSIGIAAFAGLSGLTSITIPTSVISIDRDAFQGCVKLTSISLPSSLLTIGSGAFAYCTGLTSVTLPNSITEIINGLFYNCTALKTVYSLSLTPPTFKAYNQCFLNAPITDVYVPTDAAVSAYRANTDWIGYFPGTIIKKVAPAAVSKFSDNQVIVYASQSAIVVEGTLSGETVAVYNLNGLQLQSIKSQGERLLIPVKFKGVYLVRTKDKTVKVLM